MRRRAKEGLDQTLAKKDFVQINLQVLTSVISLNYAFAKCVDFDDERLKTMMLEEISTEGFDLDEFVSDIEMDLLLRQPKRERERRR